MKSIENYNEYNSNISICDSIINILSYRNDIIHLLITGGEPFVNTNNLIYFLDKINQLNLSIRYNDPIFVKIITNGTIYTKELKNYSYFIELQISVDGYKNNHNKNRRDYDLIKENAIKYKNDGFNLSINSVIDNPFEFEKNINKFIEDFNFVQKIGVHYRYDIIKKYRRNIILDIIYYIKFLSIIKKYKLNHLLDVGLCSIIKNVVSIDMNNGNIFACYMQILDKKFGSIGKIQNNRIFVDENKLIIYEKILDNKIEYDIPLIGKYIKVDDNTTVCPMINYFYTGYYNKIPFRYFIFKLLEKIYNI